MAETATLSLPSDLVAYLAELDRLDQHASVLAGGITDSQANWQPANGAGWSVAQCLQHIAVTTNAYLTALRPAVPQARTGHRELQPAGWFSRFFLRKAEPPVSLRIKAPKKIRPASTINKSDAVRDFLDSNQQVRTFVRDTAHLDLCGIRFRNPFIPGLNFTVATGLLIINAHTRRHLWQA